jgi:hypothetical protein
VPVLEARPDGTLTAILGFSGPADRFDYPALLSHLGQAGSELN